MTGAEEKEGEHHKDDEKKDKKKKKKHNASNNSSGPFRYPCMDSTRGRYPCSEMQQSQRFILPHGEKEGFSLTLSPSFRPSSFNILTLPHQEKK